VWWFFFGVFGCWVGVVGGGVFCFLWLFFLGGGGGLGVGFWDVTCLVWGFSTNAGEAGAWKATTPRPANPPHPLAPLAGRGQERQVDGQTNGKVKLKTISERPSTTTRRPTFTTTPLACVTQQNDRGLLYPKNKKGPVAKGVRLTLTRGTKENSASKSDGVGRGKRNLHGL